MLKMESDQFGLNITEEIYLKFKFELYRVADALMKLNHFSITNEISQFTQSNAKLPSEAGIVIPIPPNQFKILLTDHKEIPLQEVFAMEPSCRVLYDFLSSSSLNLSDETIRTIFIEFTFDYLPFSNNKNKKENKWFLLSSLDNILKRIRIDKNIRFN